MHLNLRSECAKHFQVVCTYPTHYLRRYPKEVCIETPIKRFAQRHSYLHIDSIASGDLGVVTQRHGLTSSGSGTSSGSSSSSSSNALGRTDTLIMSNSSSMALLGDGSMQSQSSTTSKRTTSPDRTRKDEPALPHKRSRVSSPPPRDRDRDRWDGPSKGRRYGSPPRERERPRSPIRRAERDREEPERPPSMPQVLSWFLSTLPPPASFDGEYYINV